MHAYTHNTGEWTSLEIWKMRPTLLVRSLMQALQSIDLPVARHKAKITASDGKLARRVAAALREYGFRCFDCLEFLGMEARAGRPL